MHFPLILMPLALVLATLATEPEPRIAHHTHGPCSETPVLPFEAVPERHSNDQLPTHYATGLFTGP